MLANETPAILTGGQFYATTALAGALLYVLLVEWGVSRLLVFWVPIVVIFGIRATSVVYGWGIPTFEPGDPSRDAFEPPGDDPRA